MEPLRSAAATLPKHHYAAQTHRGRKLFSTMMKPIYIKSIVVLLLLTSALKVLAFVTGGEMLQLQDEVFGIKLTHLLGIAISFEVACCYFLLGNYPLYFKGILLCWAAGLFGLYHLFQRVNPASLPCPCLGSLPTVFGLSQNLVSAVLYAVIAYMFVVGVLCLTKANLLHLIRRRG